MTIESIFGLPGTGKSALATQILAQIPRYIAVDRLGELPATQAIHRYPEDTPKVDWRAAKLSVCWTAPARWAFIKTIYNCAVVIDEAQIDQHWTKGRIYDVDLLELITLHRHFNQDLLVITQYPPAIPLIVREMTETVHCFRLNPAGAKYVGDWIGVDPERLVNLPNYEYLTWRR